MIFDMGAPPPRLPGVFILPIFAYNLCRQLPTLKSPHFTTFWQWVFLGFFGFFCSRRKEKAVRYDRFCHCTLSYKRLVIIFWLHAHHDTLKLRCCHDLAELLALLRNIQNNNHLYNKNKIASYHALTLSYLRVISCLLLT